MNAHGNIGDKVKDANKLKGKTFPYPNTHLLAEMFVRLVKNSDAIPPYIRDNIYAGYKK